MDHRRGQATLIPLLTVLACLALPGVAPADEVDELAISRDFRELPRDVIVVTPVPQPPKGKGKLQIADSLGRIMTDELIGALKRELPSANVTTPEAAPPGAAGLLVEARFTRLVPGSRAKRFWLSFGAGKSVTEVSGEVTEMGSGRVVARFRHARLSWCCGFGSNDQEIRNQLAGTANDLAALVAGRLHAAQKHAWLDDDASTPSQP